MGTAKNKDVWREEGRGGGRDERLGGGGPLEPALITAFKLVARPSKMALVHNNGLFDKYVVLDIEIDIFDGKSPSSRALGTIPSSKSALGGGGKG